ncbi:MAG: hypothetical protein E5Y83_33325 [Mesorhizobium sp.]|nr:MAG: hypothetical protein EOS14_33630 [Mesorhizobium sp.]TIL48011.1 MAG: hypothetical protein E5Y83_33325 [Mesorhizobium sp.]
MFARGMSVRWIRGRSIKVSPEVISAVISAILEEVAEWRNRSLDAVYTLVFFDAIRIKIRDKSFVRKKVTGSHLSPSTNFCPQLSKNVGRRRNDRSGGPVGMDEWCNSQRCANWHATCAGTADGRSYVTEPGGDYSVSQLKRM